MPPSSLRPSGPSATLLLSSRPTLHHTPTTRPIPHLTPAPHPQHSQTRHATLIKRSHRPYTFTQLLTLSDGSTFLHRTTSPAPVYRSTRDTRNTPLWNPSSVKLATVEEDEAGRLRAFRRRFGRGWDAETRAEALEAGSQELLAQGAQDSALDAEAVTVPGNERREVVSGGGRGGKKAQAREAAEGGLDMPEGGKDAGSWSDAAEENLMDLIGSFGESEEQRRQEKAMAGGQVRRIGKSEKGKK